MRWLSITWVWAFLFLVHLSIHGAFGCLDEERSSLLQIKASMNYPNGTSLYDWGEVSNCCIWHRVKCNSTTGRAIELDLSFARNDEMAEWYLNASLLLPFQELQILDLSYNYQLAGFVDEEGLCKLKNLQELDLIRNEFDGTIPLCLNNLTNLQVLDLSYNRFSGMIPTSVVTSLTSMAYFFLSNNYFSGLFTLSSLAHLSNLKEIKLESNGDLVVETEHPPWVPTFQLQYLHLSNCKINKPSSLIPSFLYRQYNLTHVDLSHNNLQGNFPVWLLENNTRLTSLNLRNNSITGSLYLPDHIIFKDFTSLNISKNNLTGQIPIKIGALFPNLEVLDMSRNALHGNIPYSVGNMARLWILDLSYNNLSGELPNYLGAGCVRLTALILSNNRLSGQIPSTYSNHTRLNFLSLNDNHLIGSISNSFFNGSMEVLDVGNNYISGELPRPKIEAFDFSFLSTLNLRGNHFEGQIPLDFCKLRSLEFLDLSENYLYGSIPSCFNLSFLKYMHLEKNEFSGVIPSSLSRSSSLVTLDIRHNKIVDFLPSWIGSLSNLRALLMKGNYLHGPIPSAICTLKDLNILDLSYNNLSGLVPSCISNLSFGRRAILNEAFNDMTWGMESSPSFSYTYLKTRFFFEDVLFEVTTEQQEVEFMTKSRSNFYKGGILHYMSGIDLSCNQLTGEIPFEIGQLIELHALNLSNNQLRGNVPWTLSELRQIESLDLSHNKLTGTIPSQLVELTFLSVFKVGYNNLIGPIPQTGQFSTFEEDSYEGGNNLLCGPPVKRSCFSTTPNGIQNQQDGYSDKDISYFYGSFVGSYSVFLLATIVVLYYSKRFAIPCID